MSVVANVAINVDSRNAVSKLREVQGQAQQTERAFGGIAAAVGKLAIAFAGIQAVKFVFTQAAELQTQARSLQILAGSAEKANKIIKELQDLGAVTPFTSTELIDAAKRLQAFGIEADKVVETTRRLADASGATGAELSGLVTAYGQVQAKGRLQGEELLQFQERGIALQQELRKMYGMTGEEFQKALEKGQISAKAVEVALQRLTDVGGKYANGAIAQSDTLNGKLSTLQDSFQRLAQNIGTFFEPVFKFLIDGINAFLDRVNNGLRVSAQLQANEQAAVRTRNKFGAFRAANPFDQEAQQYEERLRKSLLQSGLSAGRAAPKAPGASPVAPALLSAASGGARGGGSRAAGASKAANDAKRAAEQAAQAEKQIQDRLRGLIREVELIDQIAGIKELQFQAEMNGNKELQIRLQGEERIIQIMQATAQTLDGITDERLKQNILAKAESEIASSRQETLFEMQRIEAERTKSFDEIIAGLDLELALKTATTEQAREQLRLEAEIAKIRGDKSLTPEQQESIIGRKTELARPRTDRERLQGAADGVKQELDKLTDPINMITNAAAGIGDAFATSFKGVISGSMTAKQALSSFFSSVADMFLDMAAQIIAKMIQMFILQQALKIFSGAAGGGSFSGGLSSAVDTGAQGWADSFATPLARLGDVGPIGFAEGGFVTGPTNAVIGEGGESEYVIPASKMNAAMSRYGRGARGEGVIADNGTTSEGGAPAAAGPVAIDVRYSVERINNVEYVTASQFQEGMRQAAQQGAAQGEQRTLRRLQQSPSTRKRVGV